MENGYLPIGLANNVELNKDISANHAIKWSDVNIEVRSTDVELRVKMEATLAR